MKIKYFEDTDTVLFEIGAATPVETRAISEDIYLDLDHAGRVVSITIEHASSHSDVSELRFVRINNSDKNALATR